MASRLACTINASSLTPGVDYLASLPSPSPYLPLPICSSPSPRPLLFPSSSSSPPLPLLFPLHRSIYGSFRRITTVQHARDNRRTQPRTPRTNRLKQEAIHSCFFQTHIPFQPIGPLFSNLGGHLSESITMSLLFCFFSYAYVLYLIPSTNVYHISLRTTCGHIVDRAAFYNDQSREGL